MESIRPATTAIVAPLETRIQEALVIGAADHFSRISGQSRKLATPTPMAPNEASDADERLENAIRICQSLMADLQAIAANQEPIFATWWPNVSLFSLTFRRYESQLADVAKPVADAVTRQLKSIRMAPDRLTAMAFRASGHSDPANPEEQEEQEAPRLSIGTSLFELYLCLQQFHK